MSTASTTASPPKRRMKRTTSAPPMTLAEILLGTNTSTTTSLTTTDLVTTPSLFQPLMHHGATPTAFSTIGSSSTSTSEYELPELPLWTLHALAGFLSCILVSAVILLLAQFPPPFTLFSPLGNWVSGSAKFRYEHIESHGKDSKYPRGHDIGELSPHLRDKRLRRRRPVQLSIDTSGEYRGLGMVVAATRGVADMSPSGEECDYSDLPGREKMKRIIPTLKTPSSSAKGFKISTPWHSAVMDIEKTPSTTVASPKFYDAVAGPDNAQTPLKSALFQKINEGIGRVADKLSETFYDAVTEPEVGLLLPVHSGEREKALVHGVLVE